MNIYLIIELTTNINIIIVREHGSGELFLNFPIQSF